MPLAMKTIMAGSMNILDIGFLRLKFIYVYSGIVMFVSPVIPEIILSVPEVEVFTVFTRIFLMVLSSFTMVRYSS